MKLLKRLLGALPVAAAFCGVLALTASAEDVSFAGKRITLIVPYGQGGGSTIHARLFAPALEKTLPGNPTIIIKNIDGAGSVKGINEFYNTAKPDGLTIASLGTGTFFQFLLRDPAVHYPLPKFEAFLTSPFGLVVYGRKDIGLTGDAVTDIKFLREYPPVYGGATATSSDLPAIFSLGLLGITPKAVFGLSNGETRAAFMRGEFNVNYDNMASWAESVKPLIDDGTAVPLFTFGFRQGGKIARDPVAPDVPTFLELYEQVNGRPLAGTELKVWTTLFNIRVMGSKMLALPPGTPKEIYDVYTKAIEAALKLPEMTDANADAVMGGYPQATGTDSADILEGSVAMNDDDLTWLKAWLKDHYGIE
ncbi:MAG: Bug family tripartite tricarboxylate transporter substrate binding protein [Cypionkella sp.]